MVECSRSKPSARLRLKVWGIGLASGESKAVQALSCLLRLGRVCTFVYDCLLQVREARSHYRRRPPAVLPGLGEKDRIYILVHLRRLETNLYR